MPNILVKLGTLDLSSYVRVNEGEGLDPGRGDMLTPAFSDGPLWEGQSLTSIHATNKEMMFPLFLHPSAAPYLQDALNQVVQSVNQQLRLINDLNLPLVLEWRNAQASNSTFFSVQFGRFEPNFVFRQTEKGWLAGVLHLWVYPYGHTGTQRSLGTYSGTAAAMVIPAASLLAGASISGSPTLLGDAGALLEIRAVAGSYRPDDGRIVVVSPLPDPNYQAIFTPSQFQTIYPGGTMGGASGAMGSVALCNSTYGIPNQALADILISTASPYYGDNRVLGLVRAENWGLVRNLQAIDGSGNALGPAQYATSGIGWQLMDFGILRVPTWASQALIHIMSPTTVGIGRNNGQVGGVTSPYSVLLLQNSLIPVHPGLSGNFNTTEVELGPIFVLPDARTELFMDYGSNLLTADTMRIIIGNSAPLPSSQDTLGNIWQASISLYNTAATAWGRTQGGFSDVAGAPSVAIPYFIGPYALDCVIEAQITPGGSPSGGGVMIGQNLGDSLFLGAQVGMASNGVVTQSFFSSVPWYSGAPSMLLGSYLNALTVHFTRKGATLSAWAYDTKFGTYVGSWAWPVGSAAATIYASAPGQAMIRMPAEGALGVSGGKVSDFRMRSVAPASYTPGDVYAISDAQKFNRRETGQGVDLSPAARGVMGVLPVPSAGGGVFVGVFPFDAGPANDVMTVEVRVRERFTYAR